jgi:hypothetical protein
VAYYTATSSVHIEARGSDDCPPYRCHVMSEIPIGDSFCERLLQIADYSTCFQSLRDTPTVVVKTSDAHINREQSRGNPMKTSVFHSLCVVVVVIIAVNGPLGSVLLLAVCLRPRENVLSHKRMRGKHSGRKTETWAPLYWPSFTNILFSYPAYD